MHIMISRCIDSIIGNHHESILMPKTNSLSSPKISIAMDNLINIGLIDDNIISKFKRPLERIEIDHHHEQGYLCAIRGETC